MVFEGLILELGKVGLWIQAVGLFIILWIIFQIIILIYNTRRMRAIYKIKDDMKRIEGKIDRILKKK